jgi:hypothetical protein
LFGWQVNDAARQSITAAAGHRSGANIDNRFSIELAFI